MAYSSRAVLVAEYDYGDCSEGCDLHDHPQRTYVAQERRRSLRGALLISFDQLTDCRVIIAKFERFGSASGICPE